MPRQGAPKPPPPPKPWRREGGGYRSADERFTIEAGGAGRWFLTDEGSLDELGLARTLGPYATLDEAKAAAAGRRDAAADASPLASLLADAAAAPKRPSVPRRSGAARDAASVEPEEVPEPEPEPEAPPRTWIDDLAEADPAAAARARRTIEQLTGLGIADADGIVRRDVLGGRPEVAATLLARDIAAAVRAATDEAGPDADPGLVARRVAAAVLQVVGMSERAADAGRELPGWRLVERPSSGSGDAAPRRLIVTSEDLPRS